MGIEDLIIEINEREGKIAVPEAAASEGRWAQAECVYQALQTGISTRKLAAQWSKPGGGTYSYKHVQYTDNAWKEFGNLVPRPTFYAAYNSPDVRGGATHVAHATGDNEWYTPLEYIKAACLVMGGIDLDPASTAQANEVVQASRFYSIEDDGLAHDWGGRVWMNPPYAGDLIGKFTSKLAQHFDEGAISAALVLVNNATETEWFQMLSRRAAAICFPSRRVAFWGPGEAKGAPLQGQAVLYLGTDAKRFESAYMDFGVIFYATR